MRRPLGPVRCWSRAGALPCSELPQQEGREAVPETPQRFSPAPPVAVGAMLEPEGVRHPVDRVEHERDVDRLGQRVVLDPRYPYTLDVVSRHAIRVTRERLHEGRGRDSSRAEPSLIQASHDVATELLGGDLAMRPDTELAAVCLRDNGREQLALAHRPRRRRAQQRLREVKKRLAEKSGTPQRGLADIIELASQHSRKAHERALAASRRDLVTGQAHYGSRPSSASPARSRSTPAPSAAATVISKIASSSSPASRRRCTSSSVIR